MAPADIPAMMLPPGMSLADIPAMRPPPGLKSNFVNPETSAIALMAVNWIFTPLAALMVFVRVFTRSTFKREQGYGWDDVLIVFAVLGSIAHAVLVTVSLDFGYGRHMWDIRAISLTKQRLHVFTSFEQTYFITVFLIKISILSLYKRLFGIYDTSRKLIYIGFVGVTLITIPAFGVAVARSVNCDGIKALATTLCHTHNVSTAVTVFSVCNTVTDFYVLLIPINRILKLHVNLKRKVGLLAIFLGGLTACIMSVVRLAMVVINFKSGDQLWVGSKITPFTIVEMNLGIICSCTMFVPAFSKKAQTTVSSLFSSRSGSSRSVLRFKSSRSEVLQTENESRRDLELARKDIPDLPPFQGNLSLSGTRTCSESNSNGSFREDERKPSTFQHAVQEIKP